MKPIWFASFLIMLAISAVGKPVKSLIGAQGARMSSDLLPYDKVVEYIEGDGTQYINTEIISTDSLEATARVGIVSGYPDVIIGQRYNDGADWRFFYPGGTCLDIGAARLFQNKKLELGRLYDVSFSNFRLEVDGTVTQSATVTGVAAEPILIMAKRDTIGITCYNVRCATLKLSSNGIVLFDAYAVRFTNEDNTSEGALYDRISGILFRNQGTGAFIIGPDKH